MSFWWVLYTFWFSLWRGVLIIRDTLYIFTLTMCFTVIKMLMLKYFQGYIFYVPNPHISPTPFHNSTKLSQDQVIATFWRCFSLVKAEIQWIEIKNIYPLWFLHSYSSFFNLLLIQIPEYFRYNLPIMVNFKNKKWR